MKVILHLATLFAVGPSPSTELFSINGCFSLLITVRIQLLYITIFILVLAVVIF